MLPKSMHVAGSLTGELAEADRGGDATVLQARHHNRQVAVKTIRIAISNFGK